MNNPDRTDINDLITRALRNELTAAERAELDRQLQLDASLRERYDLEAALDRFLDHLPDAPLASNFTSRVLQAVELDKRQSARPERAKTPWFRLRLARLATGLAVVTAAGVLTIHQYRKAEQQEMARSVASFTDVAAAMSPEQRPGLVFQDFDAIERLTVPTEADLDLELLVALQK
jgi:anti-sigma factor RsiW